MYSHEGLLKNSNAIQDIERWAQKYGYMIMNVAYYCMIYIRQKLRNFTYYKFCNDNFGMKEMRILQGLGQEG